MDLEASALRYTCLIFICVCKCSHVFHVQVTSRRRPSIYRPSQFIKTGIYCDPFAQKQKLANAVPCGKCQKPVTTGPSISTGVKYHSTCFACVNCAKEFGTGKYFGKEHIPQYCGSCYLAGRTARVCPWRPHQNCPQGARYRHQPLCPAHTKLR